jgi:hypothetical protein
LSNKPTIVGLVFGIAFGFIDFDNINLDTFNFNIDFGDIDFDNINFGNLNLNTILSNIITIISNTNITQGENPGILFSITTEEKKLTPNLINKIKGNISYKNCIDFKYGFKSNKNYSFS